jgi:hypothetical protein
MRTDTPAPNAPASARPLFAAPQTRAVWQTPVLRRVNARDAEVGATPAIGDGSFTTS